MADPDSGLGSSPVVMPAAVTLRPAEDFTEFYTDTIPMLVKTARFLGFSMEVAVDAAQDALAGVRERWGELEHPRAWATREMINKIKKNGRRAKRGIGAGAAVVPLHA